MAPSTRAGVRAGVAEQFQLKSNLQRERDNYGQKLLSTWPVDGQRLNQGPRGFTAPGHIGHGGHFNHQNAVYQSLLHIPIFVNWIRSHDESCEVFACFICNLKDIVDVYWGHQTAPAVPFDFRDPALSSIRRLARANHGNPHINPHRFYPWLTSPLNLFDASSASWNSELAALFRLDINESATCRVCNHAHMKSEQKQILEVEYDSQNHDSLNDMVGDYFENRQIQQDCQMCHQRQVMDVSCNIEAAPQVLRISVNIYRNGFKQVEPFTIPNVLMLQDRQRVNALPLSYTLSSSIAHGGHGSALENPTRAELDEKDRESSSEEEEEAAEHDPRSRERDDVVMGEGEDELPEEDLSANSYEPFPEREERSVADRGPGIEDGLDITSDYLIIDDVDAEFIRLPPSGSRARSSNGVSRRGRSSRPRGGGLARPYEDISSPKLEESLSENGLELRDYGEEAAIYAPARSLSPFPHGLPLLDPMLDHPGFELSSPSSSESDHIDEDGSLLAPYYNAAVRIIRVSNAPYRVAVLIENGGAARLLYSNDPDVDIRDELDSTTVTEVLYVEGPEWRNWYGTDEDEEMEDVGHAEDPGDDQDDQGLILENTPDPFGSLDSAMTDLPYEGDNDGMDLTHFWSDEKEKENGSSNQNQPGDTSSLSSEPPRAPSHTPTSSTPSSSPTPTPTPTTPRAPDSPHTDYTNDTTPTSPRLFSHWILNTRGHVATGKQQAVSRAAPHFHHIANEHFVPILPALLPSNPQVPAAGDACPRADFASGGYEVVILTYTREKLKGWAGKMERDMAAFD